MDEQEEQHLHDMLDFVGVRAHATAAGLLQLTAELRRVGVIDEEAISRIKESMASDLMLSRPRHSNRKEFEVNLRRRLDLLFAGKTSLAAVDPLKPATKS